MKEKPLDEHLLNLNTAFEFTEDELRANKLIAVRSFTLEQEAQLYKAKLNSQGIKCFLTNEHSSNVMGGYAIEFGGIDLLVLNTDKEAAENIVNLMDHRNLTNHPEEYNQMIEGASDKTFRMLMFVIGGVLLLILMYYMSIAYFTQHSYGAYDSFPYMSRGPRLL